MQDLRWPTYPPRGLVLDAAEPSDAGGGVRVRDHEGRVFLDAIGGIGCTPLGHAHPLWVEAIEGQLRKLSAAAATFWTTPQQHLAGRLAQLFPINDARVFLCSTGTEATEAALKLSLRATKRDVVIAFEGAFHGRTLGSIALTANPNYRDPYVTCLDENHPGRFATLNVARLPYGDLDAVGRAFENYRDRIAAVFLEPIQGEAGIYPAAREFLVGLREICSRKGALLGADEIQTGVGRTGNWAAWTTIVGDDPALRPDILWLAKALGGGFPIGACIASGQVAQTMTRGSHGSTFGGNPLACTAALATLRLIEEENLMTAAAAQLGILHGIAREDPHPRVVEIRGLGAMLGIEIRGEGDQPAAPLGALLQSEGLLSTVCAGRTVRWLFPYWVGDAELREAWGMLGRALGKLE